MPELIEPVPTTRDESEKQALATIKRVGPILLVVLPLFVPEVVAEFTPLRVDAALVIAGILPAIVGWTYAPRYAVMAIPVAGILNASAVLVFGHPVATTLFMVCIAVMVGLSALRGLHSVAAFAAIQPAIYSTQAKRRGGDSNPRTRSTPVTRFPVAPVQPLRHLSGSVQA